jgi:phosphoglycerate dehydrogenase-like enzyme
MGLVIASQLDKTFNDGLRAHDTAPTVIDVPEEQPWSIAGDADVLLVRPSLSWRDHRQQPRPLSWPGRLRWVYSASVGVDFYPRWLLDAPLVTCGRGVASDEIADYVMAAIYLQAKDLEAVRARDRAEWVNVPLGRVAGTTIGIVGFGAIGRAVAVRALAAGMQVVAVRRRSLPSDIDGVELLAGLDELFARADHIVLALPGTPESDALIGSDIIARAKPTAHLINVGRGSVLDHDALVRALEAGRLGLATLDVTEPEPLPAEHPLWRHPRVRLTPHVSSNHTRVRNVLFEKVAANLDRFVRGELPTDLVDRAAGY